MESLASLSVVRKYCIFRSPCPCRSVSNEKIMVPRRDEKGPPKAKNEDIQACTPPEKLFRRCGEVEIPGRYKRRAKAENDEAEKNFKIELWGKEGVAWDSVVG